MEIQTFRLVTTSRQTNKQETSNRITSLIITIFFFAKVENNKTLNTNSHSQSQSQSQNVRQQASQSAFFNDQPRAAPDRSENYPFFQQNKNIAIKHHARNQPHYSEIYEYSYQNQRFNTNNHHNNLNID